MKDEAGGCIASAGMAAAGVAGVAGARASARGDTTNGSAATEAEGASVGSRSARRV